MCRLQSIPITVTIDTMERGNSYVAPFIRKLMPTATEEEILEASENLRGYLVAMRETFRRGALCA
jgi:hypothetical protein